MINEAAVGMRLTVDIVDRIEIVLESLVHSYPIALGLPPVIRHQSLVKLCLFVYLAQLVLLERLLPTMASLFIFGLADERYTVGLLVLSGDGIDVCLSHRVGNGLLAWPCY